MEIRDRAATIWRDLPVAHRTGLGLGVAAFVMVAVVFAQWVTAPSYSVLYSDLDDRGVATVITELESMGVPYQLAGGGGRIMVPRSQLFDVRARLAGAGVAGSAAPQGYELLDGQGITVSDFRQRIDFQRAIEGELARTLMAMDAIDTATVHVVIPEDELFTERQEPATASVLLAPTRSLRADEVETITFLVAASVEGLEPGAVTVADVDGRVLSAPVGAAGSSTITNRNLRVTQEFESALAAELTRLLDTAIGPGRSSVAVSADLDFDETTTESETYAPESQIALRERAVSESYSGEGAAQAAGTVGVEGEETGTAAAGDANDYQRTDTTTEYGVDRVVARSVSAPGEVTKLSVAVVLDDGSVTGLPAADLGDVESLVTAAAGLDTVRGDAIAVTEAAFPAPAELAAPAAPAAMGGMLDLLPQVAGTLALLAVVGALLAMSRRRDDEDEEEYAVAALAGTPAALGPGGVDEPPPASVAELVDRQPEEIASLLRGWLAEPSA